METFKKLLLTFLALLLASASFIAVGSINSQKNNAPGDIPPELLPTQLQTGVPVIQTDPIASTAPTAPDPSAMTTVPQQPIISQTDPTIPIPTDPAVLSNAQIVQTLADAVNKTKNFPGAVSVHHKESFDATVTQCTGGSMVASLANRLVGSVLKPSDETLNFNEGKAVNSEGETVVILLPQKGAFTLNESGVTAATLTKNGTDTIIELTLIPETVDQNTAPPANAAGIGYLDVGSLDLSILQLNSVKINYTGSGIKAVIGENGYVKDITYTIPLHVEGSAKVAAINASAVFDGTETESWQFNWQ